MKKITLCFMTTLLLSSAVLQPLHAENIPISSATTAPVKSTEADELISRLNEIKAMDKSTLTSPEKQQLRKEVRSIRSKLNSLGDGGIYLSVGAIIIIILLLIILL